MSVSLSSATKHASPAMLVADISASAFESDPLALRLTLRQDPVSVTLDGRSILTLALGLIFSLQLLEPYFLIIPVALVPIALYIYNDYQNFLKLGPGGTPSTLPGYLRISWLRLWALRDPFQPLQTDSTIVPRSGILFKDPLPTRNGSRPVVVGIAPQRQIDQFAPVECYQALRTSLQMVAEKYPTRLGVGTSCFEKHGFGIFARAPVNNTCQGEVCHVHSSDSAMHLNLHPDDAREVILKGWGQRHPLALKGWFKMPVPSQFTMIYAPRTLEEVKVICRIIEAAAWWVMAEELGIDVHEK